MFFCPNTEGRARLRLLLQALPRKSSGSITGSAASVAIDEYYVRTVLVHAFTGKQSHSRKRRRVHVFHTLLVRKSVLRLRRKLLPGAEIPCG